MSECTPAAASPSDPPAHGSPAWHRARKQKWQAFTTPATSLFALACLGHFALEHAWLPVWAQLLVPPLFLAGFASLMIVSIMIVKHAWQLEAAEHRAKHTPPSPPPKPNESTSRPL